MSGAKMFAAKLINKSIVRLKGPDSFAYLQLFLTNDIRRLIGGERGRKHCIYTHLLNSNGRTLVDLFVYKPFTEPIERSVTRNLVLAPFHVEKFSTGGHETDELLIECPVKLSNSLSRMLFAMKIRKKVTIETEDLHIWSIFPSDAICNSQTGLTEISSPDFVLSRDPRLPFLGYRIVSRLPAATIEDLRKMLSLSESDLVQQSLPQYRSFLHSHGVGEGPKDHPHGLCYPMECNADFLNGMSFMKGMHTGDWLTGRNVRRGISLRTMPVTVCGDSATAALVAPGSTVLSLKGQPIGSIRSMSGQNGLCVLYWKKLVYDSRGNFGDGVELVHEMTGCRLRTRIPVWWQLGVSGLPVDHPSRFPVAAKYWIPAKNCE